MSDPNQSQSTSDDPAEQVVHQIPWVLPLAGGLLMFLLAVIAVTMA